MKKILGFCFVLLFALSSISWADSITLDSPESLAIPTSQKIGDWYIDYISAVNNTLRIRYYWEDENGQPISLNGNRRSWQSWTCRNVAAQLAEDCVDVGDPYAGCTGVGTGENLDPGDSCFSDVFGFNIRSQDVGTSIGLGLRTLIWNQMKQDILTPGNDGVFE